MTTTNTVKFVGVRTYRIFRAVLVGALKLYFKIEMSGLENVPNTGPLIIAPTHRSNIDFALVAPISRELVLRFMAKDSVFKFKPLAGFIKWLGTIPVVRNTPDRSALKAADKVLDAGEALVIFPEGTRKEGPKIEDIHEGVAYLAIKHNCPVLPVAIGGSDMAMKKGSKVIKPVKIRIKVGKPIKFDFPNSMSRSNLKQATEILRAALQDLYDEVAVV